MSIYTIVDEGYDATVCKRIKEVFSYKLKFPTYKEGLSRIYDHFI